jgi:hypothetical protein
MSTGFNQYINGNYYDLNTIFLPKTKNAATATNFFNNTTGVPADLNQIFEAVSNQPCNFTVNYPGFDKSFQSKYFTPTANVSASVGTNSVTLNFTNAAFNRLAITDSSSATITGVSGTSNYSQTFSNLLPDSKYSYTCTPSNTGTSPFAPSTPVTGASTTVKPNTLPLVKNFTATPTSATAVNLSWGATNQSDCSYTYVIINKYDAGAQTTSAITLSGSSNIPNTYNAFTNDTTVAGNSYTYTLTPYNSSGASGASVSYSVTMALATAITTFTFNSVTGTSSTGGTITFNITLSNYTSATLSDGGNNIVTLTPATYTASTKSISFDTSRPTFTLTVKGGFTDLISTKTFTYTNKTYTSTDTTSTSGYVYYMNCDVIGGGGGGGGGGAGGNGHNYGGGGGGGGAGGNSYGGLTYITSLSETIQITIVTGLGGTGGGNTNDGFGGDGGGGGLSSLRLKLTNNTIDATITATGGIGGSGGKQNSTRGSNGSVGSPIISDTVQHSGYYYTTDPQYGGSGGNGYILYSAGAGSYGAGGGGGGNEGVGAGRSVKGTNGTNGYVTATVYYISNIA